MNQQEIFDTVVSGLRKQNKKSLNADGKCAYRGVDGTKCAAGFLIPDEYYHPWMDDWDDARREETGLTFDCIIGDARSENKLSSFKENIRLILDLQEIHDSYHENDWEKFWEQIASGYNLTFHPKTS